MHAHASNCFSIKQLVLTTKVNNFNLKLLLYKSVTLNFVMRTKLLLSPEICLSNENKKVQGNFFSWNQVYKGLICPIPILHMGNNSMKLLFWNKL